MAHLWGGFWSGMRIQCNPMSNFNHPNSTPSSFRSKLGSYATGLAIGCILMGFFFYQKHRAQQRNSQHIEQLLDQQQQSPNTPVESTP